MTAQLDSVQWLRAGVVGRAEAVDRTKNVLRGYTVAQAGPFKTPGRGSFDRAGLEEIVRLGNAAQGGLKSRLGHPSMSDDGVGKFLGRARDLRMGKATDARTGQTVAAVRADLYLDRTALGEPVGGGKPLGQYVLDLAESDPDAISSSLVLEIKDGEDLCEHDGPAADEPAVWWPTRLHASDIVDTGDAVDGLLSAPELAKALSVGLTPDLQKLLRFDRVARLSGQLLDGLFPAGTRAEIQARCVGWLERYLDLRFPVAADAPRPPTPRLDARRGRLEKLAGVK